MINEGRSPTMRHVSRTHRVALDWLLDRINFGPQDSNQICCHQHQLADILTMGNFTRDEWNSLHHLCNISHFSPGCCSQNFSSASYPKTMAKRMEQGHGEERTVAKSMPTLNLVSKTEASSPTVLSPNESKSREYGETRSERLKSK